VLEFTNSEWALICISSMSSSSFVAVPITKNRFVRNEAYDLQACRNSKMATLDADAESHSLPRSVVVPHFTIFQLKLKTSSLLVINKAPSYFGLDICISAGSAFSVNAKMPSYRLVQVTSK
jgi:hypothetical protein